MSKWTAEKVAFLQAEWGNGKSAREIAELIKMPRSAVCGKAKRLGLSVSREALTKILRRAGSESYRKKFVIPREKPRWSANATILRAKACRNNASGAPIKRNTGITPGFQGSSWRTCQWIHGEPRERDFCGAPVRPGSSYCEAHHAVCWEAPRERVLKMAEAG